MNHSHCTPLVNKQKTKPVGMFLGYPDYLIPPVHLIWDEYLMHNDFISVSGVINLIMDAACNINPSIYIARQLLQKAITNLLPNNHVNIL